MSETQPIGGNQPSDQPDQPDQPTDETTADADAEQPAAQEPVAQQPAPERPRFRDRLFGLWTLVAVAIAAGLLGGLGGAALGAVVGDDDRGRPGHVREPGREDFGGRGEGHGFRDHPVPPGVPGQVPPAIPPSETPSPESPGTSNSTDT